MTATVVAKPPIFQTVPCDFAVAVTPSDSTDLTNGPCRALYIGTAGNVAIAVTTGASSVTFVGMNAGTILPVNAARVYSTNTTASNIIALY